MSTQTTATIAELKNAMPNSDAEFQINCLESGLTLAQAQTAWIERLQAKVNAQTSAMAAQDQAHALARDNANTVSPGVQAVGCGGQYAAASGDPVAAFAAAVTRMMDKNPSMPRHIATQKTCLENPELRKAMVAAENVNRKPRRG